MTAAHSQRLSGISVESTTCARADQPSAAHYRRPSEAASATMMASASDTAIAATARHLLSLACQRGAEHLIRYLLPIAAGGSADMQAQLPQQLPQSPSLEGSFEKAWGVSSAALQEPDALSQQHRVPRSQSSGCALPRLQCHASHGQQPAAAACAHHASASLLAPAAEQVIEAPVADGWSLEPSPHMLTAPDAAGLTLVHHTVLSGSAAALHALLSGSRELGIIWQVPASYPSLPPSRHWCILLISESALDGSSGSGCLQIRLTQLQFQLVIFECAENTLNPHPASPHCGQLECCPWPA